MLATAARSAPPNVGTLQRAQVSLRTSRRTRSRSAEGSSMTAALATRSAPRTRRHTQRAPAPLNGP